MYTVEYVGYGYQGRVVHTFDNFLAAANYVHNNWDFLLSHQFSVAIFSSDDDVIPYDQLRALFPETFWHPAFDAEPCRSIGIESDSKAIIY